MVSLALDEQYHLTADVFQVKGLALCFQGESISCCELSSGLDRLNHLGFKCVKSPKEFVLSVSDLTCAGGAQDTSGGGESRARTDRLTWEAACSSSLLPW